MDKGLSQEVEVKEKLSRQQSKAFKLISTTKKNVFIQGQAGTGKSTFIKYIREHLTNKNIVSNNGDNIILNGEGINGGQYIFIVEPELPKRW